MKLAGTTITLALLASATRVLAADADAPVTATRSDSVPLPAPGTVAIDRTWGEVTIEGWNRPIVEITATARTKKSYAEAKAGEMRTRLAQFSFDARAASPSKVTIIGQSPKASLLKPFGGKSGVSVSYVIHMPRTANLVLRHDVGEVAVKNLSGCVDAAARIGDLRLSVPLGEDVAVDGSAGVGDVSIKSPLREAGVFKRRALVGQSFSYHPAAPRRQIVAHVGIGSIAID